MTFIFFPFVQSTCINNACVWLFVSLCIEEGKDTAIITYTEPSDLGVYCILEEEMGAISELIGILRNPVLRILGGEVRYQMKCRSICNTTTTTTSYIKRSPQEALKFFSGCLNLTDTDHRMEKQRLRRLPVNSACSSSVLGRTLYTTGASL